MRKLYLELIQEFHYRGIDGLDKENSPDLRGDYARTLLIKRAEYRNASNNLKEKQDVFYELRKGHPDYYNLRKDKNDTETKRDALYKQLKDEKNLNNQEKEEKINKNNLNTSFAFDTLRDKRSEQLKDNKKIEDEINAHPDMKFFNNKIHNLNTRLDELNTEFGKTIESSQVKGTPKYKDHARSSKEQHELEIKLQKYGEKYNWNIPRIGDMIQVAKGWDLKQKKKYDNLIDLEKTIDNHNNKNNSTKENKIFINPAGFSKYDNLGKLVDSDIYTSNLTHYINGQEYDQGKNQIYDIYKRIKTMDEIKNDPSLLDKTPLKNKNRYDDIRKKYKYARLPEYSTFFNPFSGNDEKIDEKTNKRTNSRTNSRTNKPFNDLYSNHEIPSRKVNIPKPLIRRNEKIATIGTGIAGAGLYGLNKYITHEDLNENDFMNPFITEPEDEDGLSLSHMLGVAGAIHVGQNIASSNMLNKKQGRQVGEQIFKPDNSTKTNVKSGLKYTVAPEVGMIHNAIQDHIDYLRHNDDKNKVKDLIIIKKALKGDFASVVNNKHFQNNPELQNFLKEKFKIPVDQMLMDYHTNVKPQIDKKLTRGAQVELIRKTITNPYEETYKSSGIGDFNSGLSQSLSGKNIRNLKNANKEKFARGSKIRNFTQYMGAGALSAFEPVAGGLTLSKQILSKKYDPKKHPRIVAAQNLMHQILIDHPSKKAYYDNAKADNMNDSDYKGSSYFKNTLLKYGGNVLAGELSDLTGKMTHIAKQDNLDYLDKAQEKSNAELRRNMFKTGAFRNGNFEKDLDNSKENMFKSYFGNEREKIYPFKNKDSSLKSNDELNQKEKDAIHKRFDEKKIDRKGQRALDELEKNAKEIHDRTKKQFEGVRREEARYNKINTLRFKKNAGQLLFGNKKRPNRPSTINDNTEFSFRKILEEHQNTSIL